MSWTPIIFAVAIASAIMPLVIYLVKREKKEHEEFLNVVKVGDAVKIRGGDNKPDIYGVLIKEEDDDNIKVLVNLKKRQIFKPE